MVQTLLDDGIKGVLIASALQLINQRPFAFRPILFNGFMIGVIMFFIDMFLPSLSLPFLTGIGLSAGAQVAGAAS